MQDVLYLGLIVGFLALSWGLVEPYGLPLVDPGHVEAERLHQKEQHDQVER